MRSSPVVSYNDSKVVPLEKRIEEIKINQIDGRD